MSKVLKVFCLEDEINQLPRSIIRDVLMTHLATYATSFDEACKNYGSGGYDLILLDHDMLGYFEMDPTFPNTGYQFCKWLVSREDLDRPPILIHSHNPVGRKNMRLLLEEKGYEVGEYPFNRHYPEYLGQVLSKLEGLA